jgi:hypothetical protein
MGREGGVVMLWFFPKKYFDANKSNDNVSDATNII